MVPVRYMVHCTGLLSLPDVLGPIHIFPQTIHQSEMSSRIFEVISRFLPPWPRIGLVRIDFGSGTDTARPRAGRVATLKKPVRYPHGRSGDVALGEHRFHSQELRYFGGRDDSAEGIGRTSQSLSFGDLGDSAATATVDIVVVETGILNFAKLLGVHTGVFGDLPYLFHGGGG